MDIINKFYDTVIRGNQKAIVGFVLAAVASFIAAQGWTLDTTIGEVAESLTNGLIVAVGVWVKANR